MRHSVLRKLVTVCGTALLSLSMMGASPALAQKPKPKPPAGAKPGGAKPGGQKPGGKPGPGGGSESIELDEPATPGAGGAQGGGAKPAAPSGPPPVAGQMTEQAAQAKRLFDGEKWGDAASALYRVYKGETGDDEGNKQLAQYHLAIAL
jgi:hypothetical protein